MASTQNDRISRRDFAVIAGATALAAMISPGEISAQSTDKMDKGGGFPQEPFCSRFGFRRATVNEKDGSKRKVWMAATEDDYRQAEARRLKKQPSEIQIKAPKETNGVLDVDTCALGNVGCIGFCTDGTCFLAYDDALQLYYCYCEKA